MKEYGIYKSPNCTEWIDVCRLCGTQIFNGFVLDVFDLDPIKHEENCKQHIKIMEQKGFRLGYRDDDGNNPICEDCNKKS